MRKDSRLSRILHILAHMEGNDEPITSTQIADMLSTNPVVVRRIMGLLKESGYVQVSKGRNGGWALMCPLNKITLLDIHQLLGETSLFTIGLTDEHSNCPIENSINYVLETAMTDAEALLLNRFGEITLDMLVKRSH
ncbi:Putative HTH-type transcriptional regulator YwnA [BD1-7 clade bacterium]|uniref:HTH-type transcriptional regulator YwnA n=1 Tax=BD1-7 clade bacterium TaxID=2029982 RepID=A0A5S9PX22_9GAMM|nr:Putative HTH-type transcriptional regulator YwnA [BD1-7 clade bacterium]CAA0109677.1 Putative HTH-type transcriptional regulator YwnA [BD1-7 clade bacterium]CAA0113205.1 Putative HTH-type transcriptional regulator YwnA [BD1-7 clade bacterium]